MNDVTYIALKYVDANLPQPMLGFLEGHPWRQDDDGIAIIVGSEERKAHRGDWLVLSGWDGTLHPLTEDEANAGRRVDIGPILERFPYDGGFGSIA